MIICLLKFSFFTYKMCFKNLKGNIKDIELKITLKWRVGFYEYSSRTSSRYSST